VKIVQLQAANLLEADHVFRRAFSTFLEMPDPSAFPTGIEMLRGRVEAYPDGALAAFDGDRLVGSNIASHWGSFAWFGPLTVLPEYWGRGVAKALLEHTMEVFRGWQVSTAALFTFANSQKHHVLYQRFDFWPRYLNVIMHKVLPAASLQAQPQLQRFSQLAEVQRERALRGVLDVGNTVLEGLDLSREIAVLDALLMGDTVLLWEGERLEGFAVCHCSPNSEAEPEALYVKFAAIRPGNRAPQSFLELLHGCEALAKERGLLAIDAGASIERGDAYRAMLGDGYAASHTGVQMFWHNHPAYNRQDAYIIDDLR
jgi:GNAT superfamily N-acetyltransferase